MTTIPEKVDMLWKLACAEHDYDSMIGSGMYDPDYAEALFEARLAIAAAAARDEMT